MEHKKATTLTLKEITKSGDKIWVKLTLSLRLSKKGNFIGLLGILKAGGAYVPLDPSYPKDRLAFMLSETRTRVLLTQQTHLADLPNAAEWLASSDGHLGRNKDADDAIESANDLRIKLGESFLNLERKSTKDHFTGVIDFHRFGGKQARERVRAGLTEIPALMWQDLITHFGAGTIKHWFEVKGATMIDVHTAKSLWFFDVSSGFE